LAGTVTRAVSRLTDWRWPGLLLALTLLARPLPAQALSPSQVVIRGNSVIIDDVYRAILDLPQQARADAGTARLVARQIKTFLVRSGYLLALVRARAEEGRIVVEVDEGRLDKIIFLGAGTYKTLRMKLGISLPRHVFNKPHLVRQLKRLSRRYGVTPATYRLVKCRDVRHHGPQIDLTGSGADGLLPPPGRYQLIINLGRRGWGTGLDLDLDYDFPDGLALGVGFRDVGLLLADDRWQVGGKAGMKFREHLQGGDTFLSLSRARLEARWFTPPLFGVGLRPYLWLFAETITTQRADMEVDLYYSARLDASLDLGYELAPGLSLSLGGGVSERFIFGIEQVANPQTTVDDGRQFRPFVVGQLDLAFNPHDMRRDRKHELKLEVRHYWQDRGKKCGTGRAWYQKVFTFGWHDLLLAGQGAWVWGDYLFDDEEPVGGRYLRGVFGDHWFVTEVGKVTLEFRLSLARDLFKVSVFHDLAVFAERDRSNGDRTVRLADSFGLGYHALVLDWLQFNVYYAVGFAFHGGFDHGVSANLVKAF